MSGGSNSMPHSLLRLQPCILSAREADDGGKARVREKDTRNRYESRRRLNNSLKSSASTWNRTCACGAETGKEGKHEKRLLFHEPCCNNLFSDKNGNNVKVSEFMKQLRNIFDFIAVFMAIDALSAIYGFVICWPKFSPSIN